MYPIAPCHMAIQNLSLVNCTECIFVAGFNVNGINGSIIIPYPFKERNSTHQFSEVPDKGLTELIESDNIPTMETANNPEKTQNIVLR